MKKTLSVLLALGMLCSVLILPTSAEIAPIVSGSVTASYNAATQVNGVLTDYLAGMIVSSAYDDISSVINAYKSGVTAPSTNWSYSEIALVKNDAAGGYVPDTANSQWIESQMVYKDGGLYLSADSSHGFTGTVDSGRRGINIDSINQEHASAYTYTAPANGTVDLDHVFYQWSNAVFTTWALGGDETIGVAVYKNNTKIWPSDDSYYKYYSGASTDMEWSYLFVPPTVSNIQVKAGDKLRIAFFGMVGGGKVICYSPRITYQTKSLDTAPWSYSYKANDTWQEASLAVGTTQAVDGLKTWITANGSACGFGVFEGKLLTRYSPNRVASDVQAGGVTFTAPQSGLAKLYAPGHISYGNINWAFSDGRNAQLVIYKNDTKIWPTDADYYEITDANHNSAIFPELTMKLTQGDKVRISFVNNGVDWGWTTFNPQIDFIDNLVADYNAHEAVASQLTKPEWSRWSDSTWLYEERAIEAVDYTDSATGETLTYNGYADGSSWIDRTTHSDFQARYGWSSQDEIIRVIVPKRYSYWNEAAGETMGFGVSKDTDAVIMNCKDSGGAVALTFVAPYTGKVKLFDPDNGTMGDWGYSTLNGVYNYPEGDEEEEEMIGVAVYKNDEQIWPVAGQSNNTMTDMYLLSSESDKTVAFPEIDNLSVNAGDKLRVAFLPINNDWGCVKVNPEVLYTQTDASAGLGDSLIALDVVADAASKRFFEGETVSIDMDCTVYKADGTSFTPESVAVSYPTEQTRGKNAAVVTYDDGTTRLYKNVYYNVYEKMLGDIDCDGDVGAADLSNFRKLLLGQSAGLHPIVADVTGDGQVNIVDLVRMKKHLANPEIGLGCFWISQQEPATPKTVSVYNTEKQYIEKDGAPYVQYGIQVTTGRVPNTTMDDYEIYFAKAAEAGYTKVATPIRWRELEPVEGAYNLYNAEKLLQYADRYGLELELLWSGSNATSSTFDAPNYVSGNGTRFPKLSFSRDDWTLYAYDYTNAELLACESAALKVLMDYISYHTAQTGNNAVSVIQIENEPNLFNAFESQEAAFKNYVNALGKVVKTSAYSVVTRINFTGSISDYSDFAALEYIDLIGPDVYTTDVGAYPSTVSAIASASGGYAHYAEAVNNVASAPDSILQVLSKKAGYLGYELKTDVNAEFELGLYRFSTDVNTFVERDGTQTATVFSTPAPEVKHGDMVRLNNAIKALGPIALQASTFAVVANGETVNVGGHDVTFSTSDSVNCHGAVLVFDQRLYFFCIAESGSFTVSGLPNNSAEVGSYETGSWVGTGNCDLTAVSGGILYRYWIG